jgi:hypothetical protein
LGHGTDYLTSPPEEGMLRILYTEKIQNLSEINLFVDITVDSVFIDLPSTVLIILLALQLGYILYHH